MRRRGRPTKLSPELQEALCRLVGEGHSLLTACRLVGVDYSTVWRWRRRGEEEEAGPYWDFALALGRAEAALEGQLVAAWLRAAERDWRAAAEFLARRFPEQWGPRPVAEGRGEGREVRIIIEDARQPGGGEAEGVSLFD